jgi:hypothetical protein
VGELTMDLARLARKYLEQAGTDLLHSMVRTFIPP